MGGEQQGAVLHKNKSERRMFQQKDCVTKKSNYVRL